MIDSNAVPGSVVSREQLLPYIPERYWNSHADYHINALGVLPEAVLPSQFDSLPARTVICLQTNSPGYQIIPPNKSPEPTAVGAVSSAVAVHVASRRWLSFLR
jgi:hypothetical protein